MTLSTRVKRQLTFSGTRGTNIRWRAKLPNTGQGTPVVVGDRVFIQCHEPIQADTEMSSLTVGLCFDANSGEELWRRELHAARTTDLSSLFSDNTAASAVATKELVAFVNVGGRISVFDHDGKQKWTYAWYPLDVIIQDNTNRSCLKINLLSSKQSRTTYPSRPQPKRVLTR